MRDHRKLRAFELADKLALSVYSATKSFPKDEQFGLTRRSFGDRRCRWCPISWKLLCTCFQADYRRFLDMAFLPLHEVGALALPHA